MDRRNALAVHGIMDFLHGHLVENSGMPRRWPMFCLTYDVVAIAVFNASSYSSSFEAASATRSGNLSLIEGLVHER
jgi:hypothetical protein